MNVSKKLLLSLTLVAGISTSLMAMAPAPAPEVFTGHVRHGRSMVSGQILRYADGTFHYGDGWGVIASGSDVNPLNGRMLPEDYALHTLQGQVAAQGAQLAALAPIPARVTAVETEIREVINPHLAALDGRMGTVEGRIGILAEQNQALLEMNKGLDGQIRNHEGRIADLAGRMAIVEQTLANQARALAQEHKDLTDLQQQITARVEVPHVGLVAEALRPVAPAATPEQLADLQRQLTVQGSVITELARQADEQARFTQDHEARIRTMKKMLIVGGFVLGLTVVGGSIGFFVLGTKVAALTKTVGFLGAAVEALKTTVAQHTGLIEGLGQKLVDLAGTVTTGLRELHQFFTGLSGRVTTLETGMETVRADVTTLGQTVAKHESVIATFAQYLKAKAASWNPFF